MGRSTAEGVNQGKGYGYYGTARHNGTKFAFNMELYDLKVGSAMFAWAAPIAYTTLVAFNGKVLVDAGLVETLGVPLAGADSVSAWLVSVSVVCAGLITYGILGPREPAVADDMG